jgi:hypothetical protein
MLYFDDGTAIPWNGLVSVTESPSGGKTTETYLDGQKVLDVPGGEDYIATVESLSLPLQAAACAGWGILQYGLYASHQPRESFGLSYRTLIGNDVEGTKLAYRIHIIFGCVAKNSDFTHETTSDKASAKTYSWDITAVPVSLNSRSRATAHVIFDTRRFSEPTITTVEGILYGNADGDARMMTVDDLAILLSS